MGVPLSVERRLGAELSQLQGAEGGSVRYVQDRLLLRPSNGVVEASDYLTSKHDWVQLQDEVHLSIHR